MRTNRWVEEDVSKVQADFVCPSCHMAYLLQVPRDLDTQGNNTAPVVQRYACGLYNVARWTSMHH